MSYLLYFSIYFKLVNNVSQGNMFFFTGNVSNYNFNSLIDNKKTQAWSGSSRTLVKTTQLLGHCGWYWWTVMSTDVSYAWTFLFFCQVLKDITNRFHVLRGFRVHYVPGWDCHGLPIELKAVSDKAKGLSPLQIRQKGI